MFLPYTDLELKTPSYKNQFFFSNGKEILTKLIFFKDNSFVFIHLEQKHSSFFFPSFSSKENSRFFSFTQAIGLMRRVFTNGPGGQCSIPGRVISKTQKMLFDARSDKLDFANTRKFMHAKMLNKSVKFQLDSGSDLTLINLQTLKRLGKPTTMQDSKISNRGKN